MMKHHSQQQHTLKKRRAFNALALAAAAAVGGFVVAPPAAHGIVKFNEFHIDASGTNTGQDAVELRSTTGGVEAFDLTVLFLEGDAGAIGGTGAIDQILHLTGSTGTNGLFLRTDINFAGGAVLPAPDPATVIQNGGFPHEGAAITAVLVSGFTGAIGDDLDPNDDGVLDSTPWAAVHDAFGIIDNSGAYDKVYGAALGGADFNDVLVGPTPVSASVIRGVLTTPDGAIHGARFTALNGTTKKYTVNNSGTLANGYELTPGSANPITNRPSKAWKGATGADWGVGANWTDGTAAGAAPGNIGDIAMFDGTGGKIVNLAADTTLGTLIFNGGGHTIAAGGGTLTLDTATGSPSIQVPYGNPTVAAPIAMPKTLLLNVGNGQVLSLTGALAGVGGVTANNSGTVVLSAANTYGGITNANGGILLATSTAALPGFDVAGRVNVGAAGAIAVSAGAPAGQWSTADIDTLINTTGFNATGRVGFNVDTGNTYTYPTGISKQIGVTKIGGGVLILEGTNSYNGSTEILGGTLRLTAANQLPANNISINSGTLDLNGNDQTAGIITIQGGGAGGNIIGNATLTTTSGLVGSGAFNFARGSVSANLAGPGNLVKTGPYVMTLSGANTYNAGTTLTGGNLAISSNANLGDINGGVTFNGGVLQIDGNTLADLGARPVNWHEINGGVNVADPNHTFNVNGGIQVNTTVSTAAFAKSGPGTVTASFVRGRELAVDAGTLKMTADPTAAGTSNVAILSIAPDAKLDLNSNKLVTKTPIGTFNGTSYSGVHGEVARAYNFGSWDQPGLTTSQERAGQNAGPLSGTTTLGINSAQAVLFLENPTDTGVWAGQTVTGTDTLVMYTYAGDMNFDGIVDGADYGFIDNSVQFPGTDGYANGDLNFDGVIDGADYGIIDNTIQLQGDPIPVEGFAITAGGSLSAVTAVPEPASLSLLALGASAALGRRRRR